ncbi:hypothetical protein CPS_2604 [Colwellia psychrerythraea 34H]|uniref:Uncharacterized protein n=1 Tax=Colwellia psychrerythraea (strain 34H / ATCC BAA-681) TaxID=167879 RepID=Q481F0_COLP3|nr:hypothetical protein CPS_2604 [Colwellia psychrerythraea 34H]
MLFTVIYIVIAKNHHQYGSYFEQPMTLNSKY